MMCAVEQSLLCLEDNGVVDEKTLRDWTINHDDVDDDDDDDDVGAGRSTCRRAFHCPTLLTDDRVLANLLATESNNRPSANWSCRQTEVLPYMRDTVVTWMLEVRFTASVCLVSQCSLSNDSSSWSQQNIFVERIQSRP